jgi:hypothetical protein
MPFIQLDKVDFEAAFWCEGHEQRQDIENGTLKYEGLSTVG